MAPALGAPVAMPDVLRGMPSAADAEGARRLGDSLQRRAADQQLRDELAGNDFSGRLYRRFDPEVGTMNGLQWKPLIYTPANLTVRFGAEILDAADPRPWCQQMAAEKLGPGAGRGQVARLASCLEEYATHFRTGSKPFYAAAYFFPDFTRIPPRAMTEIYMVVDDPVGGPMTLARAREMCETLDELSAGDPGITETEVPAGPALRAHRHRKLDPGKRRGRIGEEVAWFICPPGSTRAVMMFTRWAEPVFTKAAMTIADDMARNFRTEPGP